MDIQAYMRGYPHFMGVFAGISAPIGITPLRTILVIHINVKPVYANAIINLEVLLHYYISVFVAPY